MSTTTTNMSLSKRPVAQVVVGGPEKFFWRAFIKAKVTVDGEIIVYTRYIDGLFYYRDIESAENEFTYIGDIILRAHGFNRKDMVQLCVVSYRH